VWGNRDDIIPVEHAAAAHEAIPGSRLAVLAGVGHFPHVEAPERFLSVLIDFLGETDSRQIAPVRLHDMLLSNQRAS